MTDNPPVEQCDRDAAADSFEGNGAGHIADRVRSGQHDGNPLVQAFARHRIEALTTRAQPDRETLDALRDSQGIPDFGRVEVDFRALMAVLTGDLIANKQPDREAIARVEEIECVQIWPPGEPADPIWRIEIGGYCADFEHEQAARNFANAINAASGLASDRGVIEACARVAEEYPSSEYADIPIIKGIAAAIRSLP